MNYLCNSCLSEFSDSECDSDPSGNGCPECGDHDFDEEIEEARSPARKKGNENMSQLTQKEKTAKHKEENPQDESFRKEKQRHSDGILRFHIRRQVLHDISLPKHVDQAGKPFKRAFDLFMKELGETVEVVG